MYFVNGVNKLYSGGWESGEALVYLANATELTHFVGVYLSGLPPSLLQYAGIVWFHMLLASPLLLVLAGRIRTGFVLVFVVANLGLLVSFRIGSFPLVATAGLLLFIHPRAWDCVEDRLSPLETVAEELQLREQIGEHRPLIRSRVSPKAYRYVLLFGIVFVSLMGATMLASNASTAVSPEPTFSGEGQEADAAEDIDAPDLQEEVGLQYAAEGTDIPVLSWIESAKSVFFIDQPDWNIMVGDSETIREHYFVIAGETQDGEVVDLYNDRQLSYDRPHEHLNRQYDTYRERFYMHTLMFSDAFIPQNSGKFSVEMANHLCSDTTGERLDSLSFYVGYETPEVPFDDAPDGGPNFVSIYHHSCGGGQPEVVEPTPTGFSAFEEGYETAVESVNESLDVPLTGIEGIDDDLSFDGEADDLGLSACTERPEPFNAEELAVFTESYEVENRISEGETAEGVRVMTMTRQEYTNAFAVQHLVMVQTRERFITEPLQYFTEYVVTEDFVYRRVVESPEQGLSANAVSLNTGFTHCFK